MALADCITKLCVALALVPCLISVFIIALDIGLPNWVLVLTIDLPAFLWFGITLVHHWRTRTTSTAWLFALFPIAFFEPVLLGWQSRPVNFSLSDSINAHRYSSFHEIRQESRMVLSLEKAGS